MQRTPRVMQLEGMFDLSATPRSETRWSVNMPLNDRDRDWCIGLIVGASGSGKTTVAKRIFGSKSLSAFDWPSQRSIIDSFPESMSIKEITGLLSSVGFSSPPAWLRPYAALSTGEQFRAHVARALAENQKLAVIDEFTSVVDRTVARIGSAAVAKCVRSRQQKLVAVSCHYDIIDWLQPDWIYEPGTDSFQWRELQRRPPVSIEICRINRSAWRIFQRHHYLSHDLSPASKCFVGSVEGQPAAFTAIISFPHAIRPGWREHRTVCLPDFQGVGIGNAMSEFVMSLFRATDKPVFSSTSHPAMIRHRCKSPLWRMSRAPSRTPIATGIRSWKAATDRLTAGFEFVGPANFEAAAAFGLVKPHRIASVAL